ISPGSFEFCIGLPRGALTVVGHTYPLKSGGIAWQMSANKELGHEASYARRSVAGFPQDGDGVPGARYDLGGTPGALGLSPLGRESGLCRCQSTRVWTEGDGFLFEVRGHAEVVNQRAGGGRRPRRHRRACELQRRGLMT